MDTVEALKTLGVTAKDLTEAQRKAFDDQGYFIVENVFTPEQCALMGHEFDRIRLKEGLKAGIEVSQEPGSVRISDLFNKSAAFDCLLRCKPILATAYHAMGEFKIHGGTVREPGVGRGDQPLHCDSYKMPDGGIVFINALILFDDMTLDNGPTRIVPGSHKWPAYNVPGVNVLYGEPVKKLWNEKDGAEGDVAVAEVKEAPEPGSEHFPEDPYAPYPGEIKVTVKAGTIVVCNAHMWHSGTVRNTNARRRQFHLTYTRRELPQQMDQRKYLTQALYDRMGPAERFVLDIE